MRTRHPRSTRKPVFFARNVVYSQDLRDRANKLQVLLNEQVAVRACENAGHFANRDGGGVYKRGVEVPGLRWGRSAFHPPSILRHPRHALQSAGTPVK